MPASAADLTPAWLDRALGGEVLQGAHVAAFQVERIGVGAGYAGRIHRVALSYDSARPELPASVIVKLASEHAPMRDMMNELNGYEREVRFYQELAPRIAVPTPRCYHARFDPESQRFVLVLEDLSPAAGVSHEEGLSPEQARELLSQAAAMHAQYWGRTDDLAWLAPDDAMIANVGVRVREATDPFIRKYGERLPLFAKAARLLEGVLSDARSAAYVRQPPLTVVHNDLHAGNVFFPGAEGGRLAVIDWQSVSLARHGTNDVTRILVMGMRPEVRRAHQDALLRHYHAELVGHGVEGFSMAQLKRRFMEEHATMTMVYVLAYHTIEFENEENHRGAELIGERIEEALRDSGLVPRLRVASVLFGVQDFLQRVTRLAPGV